MQDAKQLIEEWETDILLLETVLRHPTPHPSSHQGPGERRQLERQLRRARQALFLLYGLLPLLA